METRATREHLFNKFDIRCKNYIKGESARVEFS